MAITFPHIFKDGTLEPASGAQLMENLNLLKGLLDPFFGGGTGTATYAALTGFLTAGVEYEPSATRPAWVGIQYRHVGGVGPTLKVTAGGVLLPEVKRQNSYSSPGIYGPFPLAPGKKWKYEGVNLEEVQASYLIV